MPVRIIPWNLILVGLVLLPNLLSMFFPPVDIPAEPEKPARWNLIIMMERIGQIALFVLPLFWEAKWHGNIKTAVLIVMLLSIVFYYSGWLRFYSGGRSFELLFRPMLLIPVPMALSPVLYFFCLGILLESWPILLAVVIFAAGHIPESLRHLKK